LVFRSRCRLCACANSGYGRPAYGSRPGWKAQGAFDQKLFVQPFFITGNFEKQNLSGVEVLLPKDSGAEEKKRAAELAALASEARTFVAGLVGTSPDTPLRIVAVKRGGGFSSGGTIFLDESVFRRSKIDSATAMTLQRRSGNCGSPIHSRLRAMASA
jgi:hypothetical protein